MSNLDKYLPHRAPMILIDDVLESNENSLVAKLTVRDDYPFLSVGTDKKIGSWVGIEYMAQASGVLSGIDIISQAQEVQMGFLLGTRKFTSYVSSFNCGDELHVYVTKDFQSDEGLAAVSSYITDKNGKKLCDAILTLYQPR